jgi:MFS family permease
MLALPPLAVILSQYPAGLLSDRYDRRTIVMVMSAAAAVIAAISIPAASFSQIALITLYTLFGAIALPIYSLVVAHANDHLDREQMLGASGKLVLLYGLGAMLGPTLAGEFMQRLGTAGFMTYMLVIYVIMAIHALWRRAQRPESLKAASSELIKVGPVSTPVAAQALAQSEGERRQAS